MNHFPSREQVQALRERYPPGTMIQLTADMQGERFRAGDIGKVTSVDDAGQIHLAWLKGGSLAIIPGVDSFREIITEPLDLNPYLDKGNLRINGYYVDACTDNGIEQADAWGKTEKSSRRTKRRWRKNAVSRFRPGRGQRQKPGDGPSDDPQSAHPERGRPVCPISNRAREISSCAYFCMSLWRGWRWCWPNASGRAACPCSSRT